MGDPEMVLDLLESGVRERPFAIPLHIGISLLDVVIIILVLCSLSVYIST